MVDCPCCKAFRETGSIDDYAYIDPSDDCYHCGVCKRNYNLDDLTKVTLVSAELAAAWILEH
jgi:transposase-like protein